MNKAFTAPYDVPQNAKLAAKSEGTNIDNRAHPVLQKLENMGLISG